MHVFVTAPKQSIYYAKRRIQPCSVLLGLMSSRSFELSTLISTTKRSTRIPVTKRTIRQQPSTIPKNKIQKSSSLNSTTLVHKGYISSKLDYFRGWSYQQVYLNRRLDYKRSTQTTPTNKIVGTSNDNHQHSRHYDSYAGCTTSLEADTDTDADQDRILLFEHNPVYTLGRGANEEHLTFLDKEHDGGESSRRKLCRKARGSDSCRLSVDKLRKVDLNLSIEEEIESMDTPATVLAPNGAPIYRIERGGEVTYHGPGQLVCYPIVDLTKDPYKKDLHWYLERIEEIIIHTLKEYDIHGVRDDINTGVWVGENKIAAVGVSSSRWITTHGFALNVDSDLSNFDSSVIIPCGIEGRGVTSIAKVLKERYGHNNDVDYHIPNIDEVANVVIQKFELIFDAQVAAGSNLS
mmetsp:Transcript_7678/g.8776  ORF Transcript_7678/g.8776 Transcript_7678/m.8776 type:complete len:406 (-) Transcript_7678:9-1226(-)